MAFNPDPRCPLCAQAAEVRLRITAAALELYEGQCERCGIVRITQSAIDEARRQKKTHLVSAWLRRRPTSQPPGVIDRDAVERIAKDTPEYSVPDKLDLTLVQISADTVEPGQHSKFNIERDYPLVYARSEQEAGYYLRELASLGYLKDGGLAAQLTARGYQRISELQRSGRESAFAFVAMWFDVSMDEIYDAAIKPAIREAGYKPVRIDREQHANRIDDEIIGRIKGSRFMVADFSGQRHGVYFEAGLMLGLGRTVIWTCKKSGLKEVHFDTRQYNFIDYENIAEAKKRLYDRIIAIEGEGPELTAK